MIKLFIFIALVLLIIVAPYYNAIMLHWIFKKLKLTSNDSIFVYIINKNNQTGDKWFIWIDGIIFFFIYLLLAFACFLFYHVILPMLNYLESFIV